MTSLVLQGGRVIDPASGLDGLFNVLIRDGCISAIEPANMALAQPDVMIVDCCSMWVVPGLIDPHVHLRDPGFPEKETIASGLQAAAAGGFTTVAAMANTSPVNDLPGVTRYMLEKARQAGAAHLVPVSAVSEGLQGQQLVNFDAMIEAGARLFSDDGFPIDDQALLVRAFDASSRAGFAISLHEEDRAITGNGAMNAGEVSKYLGLAGIPSNAEEARVRRDLALALGSEAPVHVAHVSTAGAVHLIREAKKRGANITCEVTPHHFSLDDSCVLTNGTNARMAPPLRSRDHVEALCEAMADGTIDMIATDHAPHDASSKCMTRLGSLFGPGKRVRHLCAAEAEEFARAANGVVGLETAVGLGLSLVHRGIITPARMVEMMAANPARLLRLNRQGCLAPGAPADITIIDPNLEWTVNPDLFKSKSRNTPFAGMKLKGLTLMTMVGGEMVFDRRRQAMVS